MPRVGKRDPAIRREIGERLQRALDARDLSVREFQRQLKRACARAGVAGSSYTQVHNYLQGRREPSLPVIEISARLLGVRPAWLAFGEGQQTEEGQRLEDDARTRAVLEAVPELAGEWPWGLAERFRQTLTSWLLTAPDARDVAPDQLAVIAGDLRALLITPTRLWGMAEGASVEYAIFLLDALRSAMAEPGQGRPLAEYRPLEYVLASRSSARWGAGGFHHGGWIKRSPMRRHDSPAGLNARSTANVTPP